YRERSCPVYPRKRTSRLTATRSLPLHRLEVPALQRFLGGLERLLVVSAVRYCPDAVRTSRALTQQKRPRRRQWQKRRPLLWPRSPVVAQSKSAQQEMSRLSAQEKQS